MATHAGILAWGIPMVRGAWQATVLGVMKESDMTQHVNNNKIQRRCYVNGCQGLANSSFALWNFMELSSNIFYHFMGNRWGNCQTLFFWAPESLQMVTAAMKLKDTPWKESYDQPRQHIQKQRHYFANKGPSSQGYGFSCGHVWM